MEKAWQLIAESMFRINITHSKYLIFVPNRNDSLMLVFEWDCEEAPYVLNVVFNCITSLFYPKIRNGKIVHLDNT